VTFPTAPGTDPNATPELAAALAALDRLAGAWDAYTAARAAAINQARLVGPGKLQAPRLLPLAPAEAIDAAHHNAVIHAALTSAHRPRTATPALAGKPRRKTGPKRGTR
jgi:hypothetical protein